MRTLLQSEAVRAGPATAFGDARDELAQLLQRRLDGVMRLKDSKLLLFQAQRTALPELLALLPDAEPPTVLQVDGADTLALQALCHGAMTWQHLEALKHAGARRSEEHTSELQSLMRSSYAVFCLKKK